MKMITNENVIIQICKHGNGLYLSSRGKKNGCDLCQKEAKKEYDARPEIKEAKKEYNARPEIKEYNKEYNKEYSARPGVKEAKKEYRNEYNARPEIKEAKKEYNKEYNAKRKRDNLVDTLLSKKGIGKPGDPEYDNARKSLLPVPTHCPILGTPIDNSRVNNGDKKSKINENSLSIDKIDPSKGYIDGNMKLVSFKGNRMKSNNTLKTGDKLLRYLLECDEKDANTLKIVKNLNVFLENYIRDANNQLIL